MASPTSSPTSRVFLDCDNGVKIGRPKTIAELQAMVTMFPKAKASGMGASFNKVSMYLWQQASFITYFSGDSK